MTIPHYWNPQQVERLLDSLAALGLRRARVAALIMWRSGMRVGETVALEWRDIDVTAGSLLVRRGKGGRGRNRAPDGRRPQPPAQCGPSLADHRGGSTERGLAVAGACQPGGDAPHLPAHRGQHPLYGGRSVGSGFVADLFEASGPSVARQQPGAGHGPQTLSVNYFWIGPPKS